MKSLRKTLELSYLVIFIGALIILRLFYLQIIRYSSFQDISLQVRSRIIPNNAPRGIIYDRYGKVLVKNKPAYFLYAFPKKIEDLQKLSKFLSQTLALPKDEIIKTLTKKHNSFEPILIKGHLTKQQIIQIEENKINFPSLILGTKIIRDYPYGNTAVHLLGYTGEISAKDLKKKKGYRLNDIIGLSGIEKQYDSYLKGINGGQQIEVDPLGNPIRNIKNIELIPGDNLYLTIDIELSQKADQLMSAYKGAVVILDANNGEVLTLISKPDYNPNDFANTITAKQWQQLQQKDHPLHNRALTGYPPASAFKIFTAIAALENNLFNRKGQFYCSGGLRVGGRRFGCWKKHGHLDFYHGLVDSCNTVFYNVGMKVGSQEISRYAGLFGLGIPTGIDLPAEEKGLIADKKWKKKVYGQEWFPGDTLNMSIGQGYLLTTPLQLACSLMPIANSEHNLFKPFVLKKIVNHQGELIFKNEPDKQSTIKIKESSYTFIKKALRDVVAKGTGQRAKIKDFTIYGKTGTAETGRDKNHGWFISYADNPKIVMAVFIESGGSGGGSPAYVSQELYKWWQKNRSSNEK